MRRLLAVVGVVLVIVGLGMGIYPRVKDWFSPTSMPPQPVAASLHGLSSDSSSPTFTPSISPTTTAPVLLPSTPTQLQPAKGAVPAWLSVPSIGINESILQQGLNAAGELEPPPGQTIWYRGSARPGQVGISVIAGHVQWGATPDNFWRLSELPEGASFSIRYSDSTVIDFVVVSHRSERKEAVQHDAMVWGESAKPVVVLITCDKTSPLVNHHYLNNLLVFARLGL